MRIANSVDAYNEAYCLGIEVSNFPMRERKAFICPQGYLAMDYSKIETEAEELAILLEEIGHFAAGAFYPADTTIPLWRKQEHLAKRYVFEKYYPVGDIVALMANGCLNNYELALCLGLPEAFVQEMLAFYADCRGVDFCAQVSKYRDWMDG